MIDKITLDYVLTILKTNHVKSMFTDDGLNLLKHHTDILEKELKQ